jgi:hypothetical protein
MLFLQRELQIMLPFMTACFPRHSAPVQSARLLLLGKHTAAAMSSAALRAVVLSSCNENCLACVGMFAH